MASLLDKIWASLGSTGTTPTDEKIELGFVRNDKPTWQRLNWLFNRIDENLDSLADESNTSMLKNMQYMSSGPTLTPAANACTYFHGAGRFYMVHGVYVYYLVDNKTWTAISTYFVDNFPARSVQTTSHLIYAKSGTGLRCFPSTGTVPLDVMPPGATSAYPLTSKFVEGGSDDFVVIGSDIGILYSTSGVSGTWVAPTTPPPAGTIWSLVWHGGSNFVAINREGAGITNVYLSTDDCDTFSNVYTGPTTQPFFSEMESNADGVLMVSSDDTSVISIQKSLDDGATWATALTAPTVVSLSDIKHITGQIWMATGEFLFNSDTYGAAITKDNGSTWEHVELEQDAITTNTGAKIGFSGKKIIYQEEATGKTIKSLAI